MPETPVTGPTVAPAAAVILAAGEGTRMKSDRAKVLHEVAGRPMLAHVLDAVHGAGITAVHVVVGHQSGQVRERFQGTSAVWVEQAERRGTGHALLMAAPHVGDAERTLAVLCGDAPLLRAETLRALLETHRSAAAACTVLTCEVPNPAGYGRVLRDAAGAVTSIVEHADATEAERAVREINSGLYCFQAQAVFSALRELRPENKKSEYYLPDVVRVFLARGLPVASLRATDATEVLGVNTRRELSDATRVLVRREIARLEEEGVTFVAPENTYVEPGVRVAADTVIHPFTVIRHGVVIGKACDVGPFSHLRPGTRLDDHAEVGNFVEVKNSRLGRHSKAKHLSYLGDASIGADVNIGAGTITANYDGKRKHPTVIEDGASTGSGTVLVAPVRMGRGAKTGAGAVVTRGHDVPAGVLVAGVPARPLPATSRTEGKES
ncbi:MAG: bifunctional N-acetylglucosamine-1-phosphate uridyltransferase/glucosamine-1-phosphate acetyltransferase [Planctomycetes bacterium]|nr:bifunctional N-acetylglucosamine-1-phosphate uridyltransferase/glucosamine-1-phosphate acetyltransferase [Planctomycetota bacterium]